MGRMRKQTADYFPHFAYKGRTLTVLESKWGCVGYAFWFKLLELLCTSEGHYYDYGKPSNATYLQINAMVDEQTANDILNELSEMGKIDTDLWNEKKIIWCQSLVDRLTALYAKRTTEIPKKPRLDGEEEPPPPPPTQQEEKPKKRTKDEEKPKRKAAETAPKPEKKHFYGAEFVTLTDDELQKLVQAHGEEKTKRMIEVLDNYKGQNGKKYSSDYRAILNWVVERVIEEFEKRGGRANGSGTSGGYSSSGGFIPSGGFRGNT